MKKLPLFISNGKLLKKDFFAGKRKFYKISFKFLVLILNTEMLSLERIGSNVREIEFSFCFISTLNILINFPKVEKITIRACRFQNQFANDLKLEHINELELNYDINGEHDNFSQCLGIFPNLTDISFHTSHLTSCLVCNSLTSRSLRRLLPRNHRNVKFHINNVMFDFKL